MAFWRKNVQKSEAPVQEESAGTPEIDEITESNEPKKSLKEAKKAQKEAARAEREAQKRAAREEKERLKEEEKRKKEEERAIENKVRERVNERLKHARFADFFAFCALGLSALLFALGPVLKYVFEQTGGENILITLNTIAQYCLLAAVALPAFYFVRNKKSGWMVIYITIIVIYVVGIVLGLI